MLQQCNARYLQCSLLVIKYQLTFNLKIANIYHFETNTMNNKWNEILTHFNLMHTGINEMYLNSF